MAELVYDETGRLLFTKEMKEEYTILCPTMIEIHFRLVLEVMKSFGYKVELLSTSSPNIAQEGLKYVHNDTCYPALLVIGQFIDALNSGKYDVNKVALIITNRWWLSCFQLHSSAAQSVNSCRISSSSCYFYESKRHGKKSGIFCKHSISAQNDFRFILWRCFDATKKQHRTV